MFDAKPEDYEPVVLMGEGFLRIDKLGGQIGKDRVSVFAQQLGTRMPVSDKRVREQWQLC